MPGSPPRPVLLQARSLRFSRNGQRVFGPLNLTLEAGELLLLRGANGAGKTTLLRVLASLLRAEAGSVEVAAERAWLGHLPGVNADLGARANLDYLCGLHGRRASVSLDAALAVVGLADHADTPVRQLSAGQRKRLSLARLWASPAPLWLLDEPYANLDLDGIELLNHMLAAHLRDGGAAVASVHGQPSLPALPLRELQLDAVA